MAVKSRTVTVGVAAVRLDTADETDSQSGSSGTCYNNGTVTIYVGGSDVTTANGVPVLAASWGPAWDIDVTESVWAISGTAGQDVRVFEAGI